MSSQQNRPTKPTGKSKPAQKRTASQPLAAKTSVPASKTPSQPLSTASTPKPYAATRTATTPKATTKGSYAPSVANATAGAALGPVARVVRAFTGGFPFAGLEYVLFLGIIETNVRFTVPVGLILLGLACGVFFLKQQANMRPDVPESLLLGTVRQWLGDPLAVAGSLALLGAGLLAFSRWDATRSQGFSVLAVIALIGALLLIFVANYRRDAQTA